VAVRIFASQVVIPAQAGIQVEVLAIGRTWGRSMLRRLRGNDGVLKCEYSQGRSALNRSAKRKTD
jgi:hypothetical protein